MSTRIGVVLTVCILFTFCNNGGDSGNNTNPGDTTHIPNDTTHQPVDTGRLLNSTYSTAIYNFNDTSFIDSANSTNDSVFNYKFCNLGAACRDSAFISTPVGWSKIRKIGDKYVLGGDSLTLVSENGSSFLELLMSGACIYKIPVVVNGNRFTITLSAFLYNNRLSKLYSMDPSSKSIDSLRSILKRNFFNADCFDPDPKTPCLIMNGWNTSKAIYYVSRIVYWE